ncbi:MAG TPA: nucleotidyltransferase domain-containing protein [Prolixibacteraceae bacterium]|nr:nucleotidyltransferase domain-containing protein [Prolixibacteraceae bacterium]
MRFGLKEEVIQAIANVFARHPEVEKVLLYGSRAKGNYKPASDIDLTLLGEKMEMSIMNKISWELDDLLLPNTFDLSIFHHLNDSALLDHINRVGIVFYSKEG